MDQMVAMELVLYVCGCTMPSPHRAAIENVVKQVAITPR
jgi:hypothetical protein